MKKFKNTSLKQKIPSHLKKFVVNQNYKKYSPQDQAVWRYLMKGIRKNMSLYGYRGILSGMEKTGITFHKIPRVSDISKNLQKFDWQAVTVSGFIPPRAFMEFQLHGILPIASELRNIDHISYTPAPDIVHESVGHVPFLMNPVFSDFLKKYAETVLKAIVSSKDRAQYKLIRKLSDLKENSKATKRQIKEAEFQLENLRKNISYTSEVAKLSRFIWWTSEYGLMGSLKNPKIYGAGLISSIEEAKQINKVQKIPLDENCLKYPFDITSFQPQLFVAENFKHLLKTLDKIKEGLAWKRGGLYGMEQALHSETVNTVLLDSGLQISGCLEKIKKTKGREVSFLKFSGPSQLSFKDKELPGHGKKRHFHGYSTPLRLKSENKKPFFLWTSQELKREGIHIGKKVHLFFESQIELKGELMELCRKDGHLLLLTFKNCLVQRGPEILFDPSWGVFDLGVGEKITSVFAGPADKNAYKEKDDFEPSKIPERKFSEKQKKIFAFYKRIESLRKRRNSLTRKKDLNNLIEELVKQEKSWLEALELLEITKNQKKKREIIKYLKETENNNPSLRKYIQEGLSF